ncbi:ABC transporter G family member 20 [Sarcoptes scabiei]|uniref:ABC transporter G family member 20 n=1 Tax=Sarcoptes scabiei TaxID=52283 RepID=A0A834RIC0_SARSC|nr:ABC transporter G family member 20 [Sarcoptes scabiei]
MISNRIELNSIELIKVTIRDENLFEKKIYFDSIDLAIPLGKILSICGPERCGKTILLETLAQIISPKSGTILILPEIKKNGQITIGFMPQWKGFFEELSVLENFYWLSNIFGARMSLSDSSLDDLMRLINIEDRNQKVNTLNVLQQSLLAFFLATIHSPTILFLDEPYFGFDWQIKNKIWDQICSWSSKQQMTIVFTTKIIEESCYAHKTVIVNNRKILPLYQSDYDNVTNTNRIIEINSIDEKHRLMFLDNNKKNFSIISKNKHKINRNDSMIENRFLEKSILDQRYARKFSNQNYSSNSSLTFLLMLTIFIRKKQFWLISQLFLPAFVIVFISHFLGNNPYRINVGVFNPDRPAIVSQHLLNLIDSETITLIEFDHLTSALQSVRDRKIWAVIEFSPKYSYTIFDQTSQQCSHENDDDGDGDGDGEENEKENLSQSSNDTDVNLFIDSNSENVKISSSTIDALQNDTTSSAESTGDEITMLLHLDNTNLLIAGFIKATILQAFDMAYQNAKRNGLSTRFIQPMKFVTPYIYGSEDFRMVEFMMPGLIIVIMHIAMSFSIMPEIFELFQQKIYKNLRLASIKQWHLLSIWLFIKFNISLIQISLILIVSICFSKIRIVSTSLILTFILILIYSFSTLLSTLLLVTILFPTKMIKLLILQSVHLIITSCVGGIFWPFEGLSLVFREWMPYISTQSSIVEALRNTMYRGWSFQRYLEHRENNSIWFAINSSLLWIFAICLFLILLNRNPR